MALSRLENFLKSARGKILHVNPENLDSTDAITNDGSSPFTPFKTINRALIEAARYSYQIGLENDRFDFCTILLYSGEHYIDNRPGVVINDSGTSYFRNGSTTTINQYDINTVFDITEANNQLYLLNSIYGGVIVPRGTSIVAQDLRKTIVRPLYVPDSKDNSIERSAIFRITGASFFYGFTILDANPGGFSYKNYTASKFTPNYSHHKLTAFEYVDGVNNVKINDTLLNVTTTRTDLAQYYEKISLVYGASSGKEIANATYIDGVSVDIQPIVDEYRIVGSRGEQIGITSIFSGDGIIPSELVTVVLEEPTNNISVDTSVQISGVNLTGYDGQFVVSDVPAEDQIQYITSTIPALASPTVFGATLNIISDTINSASPYIYNVSLRSVYGLCGLHADGSKVIGFKSVVVAQFTSISLQKDNDALILYDEESGNYVDSSVVSDLYKNSRSKYKPEFQNYHIKVSNDAFAQLVSVFSIGCATQIISESGGDYSITNSNSNFGAKTFLSSGYKKNAFNPDGNGYIVGVITPEEITQNPITVEFLQIDVGLTTSVAAGAATTNRLYLYNETNVNSIPNSVLDGFKIGAKLNDTLNIEIPARASSKIVIPNTQNSCEKSYNVQRQNNDFENSIINGVFNLTTSHTFEPGEKVRVYSQNGHLPDGVEDNIYYIIESSVDNTLSNSQIKLATTFNNSINDIPILPNKKGGNLSIISKVHDKIPGDAGHPIQWDSVRNNWYINVNENDNGIYSTILPLSIKSTGRTFIIRNQDNRNEENKLYKLLYSIPSSIDTAARPPINGFIIQESNDSSLVGTEFQRYFGNSNLTSENEIKNPKFISSVVWSANEVTVTTELPHKLNVGSSVEILNVIPNEYNGIYVVTKTPNSRTFVYSLATNPGTFANDTRIRNSDLPYIKTKDSRSIFQIYKSKEIQKFIRDKQDGLYELTVVHNSVSPTVAPFTDYKFSQPIRNLYPQLDRDNVNSDPDPTVCFAESNIIGNVLVNSPQNSISKEAVNRFNSDLSVGFGITAIVSNSTGTAHTIYTNVDHGLSGITSVSIVSTGASYVAGTYYGVGIATTSGGQSASFKVVVGANQQISSVNIMSGGSKYSVGDQVSVVSGIGTTTGFVPAVLNISQIMDSLNNSVSISGLNGNYSNYNETYRITSIPTFNQIVVSSSSTISGFSTTIVSNTGVGIINGKVLSISSLTYNNTSGISTITLTEPHGLKLNSKVRIFGFTSNFYNNDVLITSIKSLTQIEVNSGISTIVPATTGSGVLTPLGIIPSLGVDRVKYYYSGITTISGADLNSNSSDATPLNIINASTTGLKQGDYIEINGEIMRIKSPITSDLVSVYRSNFGTDRKTHLTNSVIRKINIIPIELRRNSIIRASGHTFEYVGYGAGNYSTALPENQDREIGKTEKLLSQATKLGGGIVFYDGMDENGDLYSANKKLYSSTGKEELYDLPVPTVLGESTVEDSSNILETEKVIISSSIKVNGGEDNNSTSEFNGPVILNKKLTSYSPEGIETTSLFLQGDQEISRRYSIAEDTPTFNGNYGDIIYRASPNEGENIGWVYTTNDRWKTWGYIGDLGTLIYLYSGTETSTTLEGIVDEFKFVGDPSGFGVDVDIQVDPSVGFGTIIIRNPVKTLNFGTTILGSDQPTFLGRSPGTRIIYYNSNDATNADYATGISLNSLWNSVPRNDNTLSFKWFGGETEIATLTGTGNLTVSGKITSNTGFAGTLTGTLNGNIINGYGSFNEINVSGVSTFTSGPVLIGSGTSTGTVGQPLQVTGNSYISGNLGIGTTIPKAKLDITGNVNISGIITASKFSGSLEGNINSSGVSTFTNGPVLIGSATSTGTVGQPLQVTGDSYVSGNLGIGKTNPTTKLDIIGNANISGIITANNIVVANNLQLASLNYGGVGSGALAGNRNRIINGDMKISQRYGANSFTGNGYVLDRWISYNSVPININRATERITDAPDGFTASHNSRSILNSTFGVNDYLLLAQRIEGYNVADFNYGTIFAIQSTLSFYVKSSVPGLHSGAIRNVETPTSATRSYPFTYTILSPNIWEYKTITIPGDVSGNWNKTNLIGMEVVFDYGSGTNFRSSANSWQAGQYSGVTGAVSPLATANNYVRITGVQLEPGPIATPFERRPFGTEIELCQRYYEKTYDLDTRVGFAVVGATSIPGRQLSVTIGTSGGLHYKTARFAVRKRSSTYTFNTYGAYQNIDPTRPQGPQDDLGFVYVFWGSYIGRAEIIIAETSETAASFYSRIYSVNSAAQSSYHWFADAEL